MKSSILYRIFVFYTLYEVNQNKYKIAKQDIVSRM